MYTSPAELNAARFELAHPLLKSTAAELTAAIPGSSWRVEDMSGGYLTGRVGCIEIELTPMKGGQWAGTAHRPTYHPAGMSEFSLEARGEDAVELAMEILGDVWAVASIAA